MNSKILTIGDASEDIFVEVKNVKIEKSTKFLSGKAVSFELGEKIPIKQVFYDIGGSACNTAVGFSRLGIEASTIIALGQDSAAEKIIKKLDQESVNLNLAIQNKKYNTHFSIIFNLGEERTILIYRSLNDYSVLVPKKSTRAKWVYLAPTGIKTEIIADRLISLAAEKNTKIVWNPGSIQIEEGVHKYKSLLSNTEILILNRQEAIKFSRCSKNLKLQEILRLLLSHGPKIVVVTDGKEGAEVFDGKVFYKIDALDKIRVDATGAGDSFAVGLVGKLILNPSFEKENIVEALKWGIINSTSVVNKIGAQSGLLTENEIEDELKKHPRLFVDVF